MIPDSQSVPGRDTVDSASGEAPFRRTDLVFAQMPVHRGLVPLLCGE